MSEVMHTGDWTDAENLRIALLADGIHAQLVGSLSPRHRRYTVVVRDIDDQRAIAIRTELERAAVQKLSPGLSWRTTIIIVVSVAAAFILLLTLRA
jgi:hypothetical protein